MKNIRKCIRSKSKTGNTIETESFAFNNDSIGSFPELKDYRNGNGKEGNVNLLSLGSKVGVKIMNQISQQFSELGNQSKVCTNKKDKGWESSSVGSDTRNFSFMNKSIKSKRFDEEDSPEDSQSVKPIKFEDKKIDKDLGKEKLNEKERSISKSKVDRYETETQDLINKTKIFMKKLEKSKLDECEMSLDQPSTTKSRQQDLNISKQLSNNTYVSPRVISNQSNRISEKLKLIKEYECQLKQKTTIIEKQNREIQKLQGRIQHLEGSSYTELKNENYSLHKKLQEKSRELLSKGNYYDQTIVDLKRHIERLTQVNKDLLKINEELDSNLDKFKKGDKKFDEERVCPIKLHNKSVEVTNSHKIILAENKRLKSVLCQVLAQIKEIYIDIGKENSLAEEFISKLNSFVDTNSSQQANFA